MGLNNVDTTPTLSLQSPNALDLSLPLYIYCAVDEFSTNVKSSNNFDNASFVFENKVNGADVLVFTSSSDYAQPVKVTESSMNNLHIRFTTHNNVLLNINNNDWIMILKLYYD